MLTGLILIGVLLGIAAWPVVAADDAPFTIPGGFSAAGGLSAAGPYAGVLVYDVSDPAPPPRPAAKANTARAVKPPAKKSKSAAKTKAGAGRVSDPTRRLEEPTYSAAPTRDSMEVAAELGAPRRLVLAVREGGAWRQGEIARARRIDGPVCPKEKTPAPVLAWTEVGLGEWRLCLWRGGETRTITHAQQILRNPSVALTPAGPLVSCELDRGNGAVIHVYDERGAQLLAQSGRHGRLAATPRGALLLSERVTPNAVWLEVTEIEGGKAVRTVAIKGPRDYAFNADLAVDPASGTAWIAAECAVAFGAHCQLGLDRELRVWSLAPGAAQADPCPDAARSALPIARRAFKTGMGPSTENTPPIRPRVLCMDGKPAIAFREFRCRTKKDFGWDVLWTRLGGNGWSAPARLTEQVGPPDTGYALLPDGAGLLGIFPELDNPGNSAKSYAPRVACRPLLPKVASPMPPIPLAQAGAAWRTPERFTNIAPAPPALAGAPKGLTLLWGDMHAHTVYSKCVPAANGMPDEMIRYQRDVLGLQVFGLLEHTQIMGLAECVWTYDRLEAEAGRGAILLYGTEPGTHPGRHTNYYATTRNDFDRICSLFRAGGADRAAAYSQCVATFPGGQAVALRHFHGDTATDDANSAASFEPRLEVAMEAMQGRGNNLLGKDNQAGFPAIYLNHGFKIGLVGGSDHFRETEALNRYCLTGFWVTEPTAAGVWDALRHRRTLAVSNGKVALWAAVADKGLGEDAAVAGPVRFKVSLAAPRLVRRVTLIRDGVVLPWTAVGKKEAALELEDKTAAPGRHWYVVTAEGDSAYPEPVIAHASPIFVTVSP